MNLREVTNTFNIGIENKKQTKEKKKKLSIYICVL